MGTCKEKPSCSSKTDTVHLKAKQLKEHQPVFHTKKYKTKENTHIPHQKIHNSRKTKIPHQKTKTKTKHVERKQKTMNSICEKTHTIFRSAKRTLNPRPLETCFFVAPLFSSKVRYNLFQEVCGFWSETLVFLKLLLFFDEKWFLELRSGIFLECWSILSAFLYPFFWFSRFFALYRNTFVGFLQRSVSFLRKRRCLQEQELLERRDAL